MFGPERIEPLIAELNEFSLLEEDTLARLTLIDIYRWVYHSNRGNYVPVTPLSEIARRRFPRLSADLGDLDKK